MEFTPLTDEQLAAAQSKGAPGAYKTALTEFVNGEDQAVNVMSAFPGAKPSTVQAGLKNAQRKDNAFTGVRIVLVGDVVALIK